ncbi:bacteriocin [Atopobacter phocae]|uniref:bacteriocin n=1 Tax=Atopobacter phocae TaxID=136492 RepID=UPI00046F14B8|nr:bacteriocin [Atopobacter phocae]
MIKAIQIEWLKSKRTKSFMISIMMMLVAVLWSLAAASKSMHVMNLQTIGLFFNNLQTNPIFLPIATCLFISRIVSNEKEGRTFKLQEANNTTLMTIFNRKLIFANMAFFLLNVAQVLMVYLYVWRYGIDVSIGILILQTLGLTMSSFTLLVFFLYLSMVIDKQGLLIGMGVLSGFFGIIMTKSLKWINLIFPFGGSSFLALYRFELMSSSDKLDYAFIWDKSVPINYVVYAIYCLLCYLLVRYLMMKKEEEK